ncbi:hypothetical protein FBU30_010737 [Linnemannia zychae]|nr:hypothetical protein FBU30_010737 [Linnemannia zychae]
MRHSSIISTSARLSYALICFLTLNRNIVYHTYAQGQPQPCGGAAYAVVGNRFYIHGGALSADNLLSQLWALNLTTNWTTAQPAWVSLGNGPFNAYHSAGYSSDNATFITFGRDTAADPQVIPNSFVSIFDVASGKWTKELNPQGVSDNSRRDFTAVTNPAANKVYLLGGDAGPAGSIYSNMFSTYDIASQTVTEITTPSSGPQSISTYAAVWSAKLKAMVVIGGSFKAGGITQGLYLYYPNTGTWTTQPTNGPFNYARTSACAASNGDGSLIAVFGGFLGTGPADPAIYILNTATWTWTTTKFPGQGRGNAACAIVDDTFLVWGGFLANPNTINGVPTGADTMTLYSISKSQWLTTYTPSSAMTANPGYPGNNGSNGGNSGNNWDNGDTKGSNTQSSLSAGALGGIIAGAVLAIGIAIFALVTWYRRRKHPKPQHKGGPAQGYESAGINSMEEYRHASGPPPPRPPPPGTSAAGQYQSLKLTNESLFDPRQSIDGSYGSGGGHNSNATTPTTLDFLHTENNRSDRIRQSYQSDGSVYYPPPPGSLSHQPIIPEDSPYIGPNDSISGMVGAGGRRFNDPHSFDVPGNRHYQYAGFTGSSSPVSGPGYAVTGSDYHDGSGYYGDGRDKHMSGISTQTGYSRVTSSIGSDPQAILHDSHSNNPSPPIPKRIVSGPQGGDGFGFVIEPTAPGAPQALLEHQRSIVRSQQEEPQQSHVQSPQSPPLLAPRPSPHPSH